MERTKRIRELSEQGMSSVDIMKDVGIEKYGTFYQICNRNGIKPNSKRGRPHSAKDRLPRTRSCNFEIINPIESADDLEIEKKITDL